MRHRLEIVKQSLGNNLNKLSLEYCWSLANAPVDPMGNQIYLFRNLAQGLTKEERIYSGILKTPQRNSKFGYR